MKTDETSLPVITPFQFEAKKVRVVQDPNGTPWWVAKDVCDVLEHSDANMAVQGLDEDEKGTRKVCTLGGEQEMTVISESGLYALLIRSNKPQAKPFRKWVTSEVLPAIRRTGHYNMPGAGSDPGRGYDADHARRYMAALKAVDKAVPTGRKLGGDLHDLRVNAVTEAMRLYDVDLSTYLALIPETGAKGGSGKERLDAASVADRFFNALGDLPEEEREECVAIGKGRMMVRLSVAVDVLEGRGQRFIDTVLRSSLRAHRAFLAGSFRYKGSFGTSVSRQLRVWVFDAEALGVASGEEEGGRP